VINKKVRMGLLTVGKPLSFPDSKRFIQHVKEHGILQFLHTWERVKGIQNDELKWGDEIEVGVFVVDHEKKTIRISLRGAEVL
jgi:glutamate--cysteine ligase catalytic subunit